MTIDVGDVKPLTVEVLDVDGNLANAGTAVVTVTLPDGTAATPTVFNPTTGRYEADYATTQAGRHVARWAFTGANFGAEPEIFNVAPAEIGDLVGLDEVKRKLNITGTTHDDDLRHYIGVASQVAEDKCGAIARRTVVETYSGGRAQLALRQHPVVSVTSITQGGTPLAATAYELADAGAGVLAATSGVLGSATLTVTYVVGRPVIPGPILEGVLELVRHLWATRRGPAAPNRLGPLDDPTPDPLTASGAYLLPWRVEQLWAPYVPLGVG
jgi:hypothetical protein